MSSKIAKDGVNLQPADPERLYGAPDVAPGPKARWADFIRETPLGTGHVPFPDYLATLRESGFRGYLTIEREVGDNPRQDIATAVAFLREAMQQA